MIFLVHFTLALFETDTLDITALIIEVPDN